jgi:hypothetical protein
MTGSEGNPLGSDIADRLSRLSPHRTHESNWLMSLLCRFGGHCWHETEFGSVPPQKLSFCLWCTKVKVGGSTLGI